MSVEEDLIDHWARCNAEIINKAAFNFAMAFARMDNATIVYPAVVDLLLLMPETLDKLKRNIKI